MSDMERSLLQKGLSRRIQTMHKKMGSPNFVQGLLRRELGICNGIGPNLISSIYDRKDENDPGYKITNRIGHTEAITAIFFDVSGKFVFTVGSQDLCIKVWRTSDGMLMSSLRGAQSSICQIALNFDNTVLAAGCGDNTIICWSLQTCATVAVLQGQPGRMTGVAFHTTPKVLNLTRYMVSTYVDGSIRLWKYFDANPLQFDEGPPLVLKNDDAAAIDLMDFSVGGTFFATTNTNSVLMIYHMTGPEGPIKILQSKNHANRIVQLRFTFLSLKFLTASEDGLILIWTFNGPISIKYKQICYDPVITPSLTTKISGADFNCDETLIITITVDSIVKVWSCYTGTLIATFAENSLHPLRVVVPHPTLPHLICTGWTDNQLMVWSLEANSETKQMNTRILMTYYNETGTINDLLWSPDGISLAYGDSNGGIVIISPCRDNNSNSLPNRMFFQTDSVPVVWDVMDDTFMIVLNGMQYHLLPTGVLVDDQEFPHSIHVQKKVPKKDLYGLPIRPIIPPPSIGQEIIGQEILTEINLLEAAVFAPTIISTLSDPAATVEAQQYLQNSTFASPILDKSKKQQRIEESAIPDKIDTTQGSVLYINVNRSAVEKE